jgi:hypothetical protein
MEDVTSVEQAPEIRAVDREDRLKAAIKLHKVKKTPGRHRAHFERRQQAKERADRRD